MVHLAPVVGSLIVASCAFLSNAASRPEAILAVPSSPFHRIVTQNLPGLDANAMEIISWSWGATKTVGGVATGSGGASGGKPSFAPVAFSRVPDSNSPIFASSFANGKHLPTISISMYSAGAAPKLFYKLVFSEVILTGVNASFTPSDGFVEDISFTARLSSTAYGGTVLGLTPLTFAYGKIKETYTSRLITGAPGAVTTFSWNIAKNAAAKRDFGMIPEDFTDI